MKQKTDTSLRFSSIPSSNRFGHSFSQWSLPMFANRTVTNLKIENKTKPDIFSTRFSSQHSRTHVPKNLTLKSVRLLEIVIFMCVVLMNKFRKEGYKVLLLFWPAFSLDYRLPYRTKIGCIEMLKRIFDVGRKIDQTQTQTSSFRWRRWVH